MRRPRIGASLFWIFFVPYVLGVAIFLGAGLAPSVVREFDGVHDSLHEYADDTMLANSPVSIRVENRDPERSHLVVIDQFDEEQPLLARRVVPARGEATLEFVAPAAGSYRVMSPSHPGMEGEIRFADDGARSLALRMHASHGHFERADASGWQNFARRVAGAAHRADHGGRVTLESLFSVLNLGLGLLLVVRRPRDRTARLLAIAMVGTAITFNHQSHSTVRDYLIGDLWDLHDLTHILSGVAYMYAVIVFPDGRLLPPVTRRRWLLRAAYGVATLILAVNVLDRTSVGHPGQSFFTVLFGVLIPVVGVAAQSYRLRHATDPVVRQQSRLLRFALLPLLVGGVIYLVLTGASDATWIDDVGLAVFPALFALVPLALVMGILRYRLWDIDVLVSRTLLSVGLAAFIGLVYVVVVVVLGHGLGPGGSAGLKIVATAIAAVAFEPVRERLQRFANRLVYGERATPYEVMAEFSDRLAGAISVDEILPRIAEATVTGVGGVAGQVTAFLPGGGRRTVHWPEGSHASSFSVVMPVTYHGEQVGEIAVATVHDERLGADEEELLGALASQAGLAVNNARLTIELQARLDEISVQAAQLHASRQRIVTARQVQRQRVVQLIHDRVEVRLHHVSALLAEVEPVITTDLERAVEIIDALLQECGEALDAMRELARGIFPAILADQGVVVALEAYVLQARLPIDIRVEAAANDRYDPQSEAIVYFCVIQALANAGAYAPESNVNVQVAARDGQLWFSVTDDGPGTEQHRLEQGADIGDMRDRVDAVDGRFDAQSQPGAGTVISGEVPQHTSAGTPVPAAV